ncbi:unnamed protein product, partial [Mesorhabditis belari]|uniref:Tubulin-specific chaperone E n=1 Tax=Mesorhabditis belari TaxID=2138241 RepID=A0AAF3EXL6_9BILA
MVEEELGPSAGDRITKIGQVDERGSVRYVGLVDGQKGTWIGVEWDNPSRGRHNGTIEGKTYFQTEHPTGGSFIKTNVIDCGRDLLDQIRERYEINDDEENEKMGGVTIEKIGMNKVHDKQKNIFYLGVICLAGMRVSSPPPKLTPHFINCTELNLHGNLLHRWKDIFEIINFFSETERAGFKNNVMENLADVSSLSLFPIVTAPVFQLVLNYCKVTETTISAVLSRFPNVTDLYASGNRLTTFNPGQSGKKLRLVDLELNPIKSLEVIDPENFMENLEN